MLWKHFSWIRPKTLAFGTSGVHIFVYEINLFKTFRSLKCLDWGTGLIQTTNYLVHPSCKLYWAFLTTSCLSTCKILIFFSRTTGPFSSNVFFRRWWYNSFLKYNLEPGGLFHLKIYIVNHLWVRGCKFYSNVWLYPISKVDKMTTVKMHWHLKKGPQPFPRGDNGDSYPPCLYNHSFAKDCLFPRCFLKHIIQSVK